MILVREFKEPFSKLQVLLRKFHANNSLIGRQPVYPQDFSWEDQDVNNKRCLRVYEPRDPLWREKYLCYKGFSRDLGLVWSHRGRIPDLDCIRVKIPFRPWWTSWHNNYLCAPKNCMYK